MWTIILESAIHILYLLQYFTTPDGSGGTRPYEMARRLVKAGHRVTLVTSGAYVPARYLTAGDAASRFSVEGIDVVSIPVPYSNKLSFSRRLKAFLDFAARAALEAGRVGGVDLVFASSTPLTIALPAVWAKRKHRVPMVFEVRDLWPEVPIAMGALRGPLAKGAARALERWAYRHSARVVALSPGMKDGVVRGGCAPEKVVVVPNSSDVELFRVPAEQGKAWLAARPELQGSALVTYGGTLGMINGVEYLVEIAGRMKDLDPAVKFLLVGDGNRKQAAVERARSLGVLDRTVFFRPPVLKKEMPSVLSATTVSVSTVVDKPELWNNSANKFFDALAAGRPMMINHEGWLADAIRGSGAGLVVPPADPAAAAALLRDFVADGPRLEKARAAARALADGEFGRDALFARLLAALEAARAEAAA